MFFSLFKYLQQEPYKIHPLSKKLGMIQISQSLENRFKRHQNLWKDHLDHCHSQVLEFCNLHPQAKSLAILGSSHLFELPTKDLIQRFEKIYLIDLVHPPAVVKLAKQHPQKIELLCYDVSGALENLESLQSTEELMKLFPSHKQPLPSFDLLISANLASQLHLLYIDHLEKKGLTLSVEEKDQAAQAVIHDHLAWLCSFQKPVHFFADRKVFYRNPEGQITYSGAYAIDLSKFQFQKSWVWQLANLGEISPLYSLEMEVESYFFNS
jgi:hypothetical protein